MVPTGRLSAFALTFLALAIAGCSYKPTVPPSQGHINAEQFPPKAASEKIMPPVTVSQFVPPPKPQVKVPTYSVVVQDVPVENCCSRCRATPSRTSTSTRAFRD